MVEEKVTLQPNCEYKIEGDEAEVIFDLPGVRPEFIRLQLIGSKLEVDTTKDVIRYSREVELGCKLKPGSITAYYHYGKLKIKGSVIKSEGESNSSGEQQPSEEQCEIIPIITIPDSDYEKKIERLETEINNLRDELGSKTRTVEEFRSKLIVFQEEFVRHKRMAERELEEFRLKCTDTLLLKLLDLADNFERALNATKSTRSKKSLLAGLQMINNQLRTILKTEGLREIECIGKPFDPNLHEVLAVEPSSNYSENTVIDVIQRGYIKNNRVLRHAKVKIAKKVK